jgi:hypothetical protein
MRRLLAGLVLGASTLAFVVPAGAATTTRPAPSPPRIHLRCAAVHPPATDRVVVGCKWTKSAHPKFRGYKLVRIGGGIPGRTPVFRSTDRDATAARDRSVRDDHRYAYGVVVLGPDRKVLQVSNVVAVHT